MRRQNYGGDVHGMIDIPPLSLVKGSPMPFFQFHVVTPNKDPSKPPNRIIGWAHPKLLNLLRYPGVSLFVDGTFRCAPPGFAQCLIIMVFDVASGLYASVYFVLMTQRTADAYFDVMHQVLLTTDQQLNPAEVICDFERALIDVMGTHFPNAEVIGCLFHFKQALLRRMKKLCIPSKEIKIAMEKRVLDMLTVIDPETIQSHGCRWVRKEIKRKCREQDLAYSNGKWKKFWAYFDRPWIKRIKPHLWNVSGLNNELIARTNNPLERLNRRANTAFARPHPSLPVFVAKIGELSQEIVDKIDNVAQGRARRLQREKISLPRPMKFADPPSDSSDEEDETDRASIDDESESEHADYSFDFYEDDEDSLSDSESMEGEEEEQK